MDTLAIQTRGLTRHFGKLTAVEEVNLAVPQGSIFGFLGPNGAGKTTTIRMLLDLIHPNQGEVLLFGRSLRRERTQLLQKVGTLVETPAAFGHLTGRENLEYLQRLRGGTRANVAYVLELVGMTDAADRLFRQYSLGMKQRLGIAATLLNGPELLILDEPSNGLDPAGIMEIRELIRRLTSEHGLTIFLSSHILSEVEQVATHIGIIHSGRLRFQGSLDELRTQAQATIRIRVDDRQQAVKCLQGQYAVQALNGCELVVQAPAEYAGMINRKLVESGITVQMLNPFQASLEQVFLQITQLERKTL